MEYLNIDKLTGTPLWTLPIQIILGFIATLIATLIGVKKAFSLERRAEEEQSVERVTQHLESVRKELEINKAISSGNYRLLSEMQDGNTDGHYALNPLNTEAWDAAINERIIELLNSSTHQELQQLYSEIRYANELIHRLRMEPLHQNIGDSEEVGPTKIQIWTITVNYWDEESEEVVEAGLGDAIRTKSNSLRVQIEHLLEEIDNDMDEIGDDEEEKGTNPDPDSSMGFNKSAAENYVK